MTFAAFCTEVRSAEKTVLKWRFANVWLAQTSMPPIF